MFQRGEQKELINGEVAAKYFLFLSQHGDEGFVRGAVGDVETDGRARRSAVVGERLAVAERTSINAVDAAPRAFCEADAFQAVGENGIAAVWFGVEQMMRINALEETAGVADGHPVIFDKNTDAAEHGIVAVAVGIDECFTE